MKKWEKEIYAELEAIDKGVAVPAPGMVHLYIELLECDLKLEHLQREAAIEKIMHPTKQKFVKKVHAITTRTFLITAESGSEYLATLTDKAAREIAKEQGCKVKAYKAPHVCVCA